MDASLLKEIRNNLKEVIEQSTPLGVSLWQQFIALHPADMADIIADMAKDDALPLFNALPQPLKIETFQELPDRLKVATLAQLPNEDVLAILNALQADELTDLFDYVSDQELRAYMNLLNQAARERVLSLMKFHPESAGGIMDAQVFTLMKDFTVEKSIKILQRLKPDKDVYASIYVTDEQQHLLGHIDLKDLVLQSPQTRISAFMQKNELVIPVDLDRDEVAHQMVHYGVTIAPVVSKEGIFLGVIPADTLADVLVEEAGEDVQRISAMAPLKHAYFDTPFMKLLFERGGILIILLLVESLSSEILKAYESSLGAILYFFVPMIISTGGNTSSQTSAVAIQGMASGDIRSSNMKRFLKRELLMGAAIGLALGLTTFARVYITTTSIMYGLTISLALGIIVMLSVVLGSCVPLVLKRLNIDPAFSAGPFLATAMDIIGILIYCYVSRWLLF